MRARLLVLLNVESRPPKLRINAVLVEASGALRSTMTDENALAWLWIVR